MGHLCEASQDATHPSGAKAPSTPGPTEGFEGSKNWGVTQGQSGETGIAITNINVKPIPPQDLDNDQMEDGWETQIFGDTSQSGQGDYDGDGVDNLTEYQLGSDPTNANPDVDGDGLDDAWEILNLGDLSGGADDDPDNDGYSNEEEQANGTDPLAYDEGGFADITPVLMILMN